MTLKEALDAIPSKRPELTLAHRYGAELRKGDRINVSPSPLTVVLMRIHDIKSAPSITRAGRDLVLTMSNGEHIETHTSDSWYIER